MDGWVDGQYDVCDEFVWFWNEVAFSRNFPHAQKAVNVTRGSHS